MTIHRGQTDRVTKIELPSAIDLVAWRAHMAAPGGKAGLDVFTSCVGNGRLSRSSSPITRGKKPTSARGFQAIIFGRILRSPSIPGGRLSPP